MKRINFLKIIATSSIFLISLNKPASAKVKDFSCNFQEGRTIAVVETRSGKIDLIDWEKNYSRVATNKNRAAICREVTERMDKYARLGELNYISIAQFNNTYFICASDRSGNCISQDLGLLFSIESSQPPQTVFNELFGEVPISAIVPGDKLVIDFDRLLEIKLPENTATNSNTARNQNRAIERNTATNQNTTANSENRFSCIEENGVPTTIVETSRGTIRLIVWQSNYFANSGYNFTTLCNIISDRFQRYSNAGMLRYVATGILQGQNAICVSDRTGNCYSNGLLMTLESGDNPRQILSQLFNYQQPTRRSSRRTKTVINLDLFLERRPVMTENSSF